MPSRGAVSTLTERELSDYNKIVLTLLLTGGGIAFAVKCTATIFKPMNSDLDD
jgi:hypothetical protein